MPGQGSPVVRVRAARPSYFIGGVKWKSIGLYYQLGLK